MGKVFAAHQPNYIPYLCYFYKMAKCDYFVYLDNVEFSRGSFANRNKIKTPQGQQYLTIPISTPKGKKGVVSYQEVKYASNFWKKKHLKSVSQVYARAPYFYQIYPIYESIIMKENQSFVDKNIELIEAFASYLNIQSKRIRLSEILDEFGNKTNLICNIGEKLQASFYLSGTGGGVEYNDGDLMNRRGIKLVYSDFKHPYYPQLWGEFVSHMSIMDVLFNVGKEAQKFLEAK